MTMLVLEPYVWMLLPLMLLPLVVVLCKRDDRRVWPLSRRLAFLECVYGFVPAWSLFMLNVLYVLFSLRPGDAVEVSDTRLAFTLASMPAFGALFAVMLDRMCGNERTPRSAFVLVCYVAVFPVCIYAVDFCLAGAIAPDHEGRWQVLAFALAFAVCFLVALRNLPLLVREVRWRS